MHETCGSEWLRNRLTATDSGASALADRQTSGHMASEKHPKPGREASLYVALNCSKGLEWGELKTFFRQVTVA